MIFEANGAMTYLSFRPLFDVWYEILLPYTARRDGLKHVLFDFERSISKFDLRSGQVKARSRSGHDPSKLICISSEASCETSRLAPSAPLYLHSVASYWQKKNWKMIKLWARGASSKFLKNKLCCLRLPSYGQPQKAHPGILAPWEKYGRILLWSWNSRSRSRRKGFPDSTSLVYVTIPNKANYFHFAWLY